MHWLAIRLWGSQSTPRSGATRSAGHGKTSYIVSYVQVPQLADSCTLLDVSATPLLTPSALQRLRQGHIAANALLEEASHLLTMPTLANKSDILLSDTRLHNALITQPQQRNTAGRIFGGFLMRRAYELAFATA